MSRKYKGLFISFEGGEASGKTTQIKKIKKWLKDKKLPYIITREPGGTKLAETLRKIILSSKDKISTDLEVLLLISSRIDHINRVINPSLIKNKTRNLEKEIEKINKEVVFLEKQLSDAEIDYIYLSSPKKLKKYLSTFGKEEYLSFVYV